MIPFQRRMNPYIQRMVEDMQVRNFSDRTIDSYTYHADKFCVRLDEWRSVSEKPPGGWS